MGTPNTPPRCVRCEEYLDGQRGPTCRTCGFPPVTNGMVKMGDLLDYLEGKDAWEETGLFDELELT